MKRFFCILLILCSFLKVEAQFPSKEQPLGFSLDMAQSASSSITLLGPDMRVVEEEDALIKKETGRIRVAYPVRVNFSPENSGHWEVLPDGGKLWRLEVTLPGALATYAMYDKFWLPEGSVQNIFSKILKP